MVSKLKKYSSLGLIVLVIVNLVLFGFGALSPYIFWGVIGIAAIFTYFVLPKIK